MRKSAPVFAALGDETRLTLLMKLSGGERLSISRLSEGSVITRQAITKHLRVLQAANLVGSIREGRESLYILQPDSLTEAQHSLDVISRHWDEALARLKAFVEE